MEQIPGPLTPGNLAAVLRAMAAVCHGEDGRDHTLRTAAYTVVDRVTQGLIPDLEGARGLSFSADGAYAAMLFQTAAAVARAVSGTVPADPVAAALAWQRTISAGSATALGDMLLTAAGEVERELEPEQGAAVGPRRQG